MTEVGLLVLLWRILFGAPKLAECSAQHCSGFRDARCGGGNCTKCCNERCFGREVIAHNLAALSGMGHDARCMVMGSIHVYMCRTCRLRLTVSMQDGAFARSTIHSLVESLETCDTHEVRKVMES